MLPPPAGEEEEKMSWIRQKEGDESGGEAGSCSYSHFSQVQLRKRKGDKLPGFCKQQTPLCNPNLHANEYLFQWNHLLKESSSIYHLHAQNQAEVVNTHLK